MRRAEFRPDIDYLRAIAVLSVTAFHYGLRGFSGGFVGVDIFFVISGYLITRLIVDDVRRGTWSFRTFYARRAKRLLPALYAMIVGTGIAGWFLVPPYDYRVFFESAIAAVLFSANLFFLQTTGYFDVPDGARLLLHTWSLSVEEQFYFVFPVLTLLAMRFGARLGGRAAAALLLAVILGLCAFDEWLIGSHPSGAFYLAPLRAWEFLVGSALVSVRALAPSRYGLRLLLAVSGVIAIGLAIGFYNAATRFPGFAALGACLGPALVILAFERDDGRRPPLPGRAPALFIGKISYSLYLWHLPVYLLAGRLFPVLLERSLPLKAAVFGLVVLLATASYRWVEQPARRAEWSLGRVRVPVLAAGASLALIAVAATGILRDGFPDRFDSLSRELLRYNGETVADFYRYGTCFLEPDDPVARFDQARCLKTDATKPNILLVGDSTAAHYGRVLERHLTGRGFNLLEITSGACAPFVELKQPLSRNCDALLDLFRSEVAKPEIAGVILAGNWRYFRTTLGRALPDGHPARDVGYSTEFGLLLGQTITTVTNRGKPLILLGPSIEFPKPLAPNLVDHLLRGLPLDSTLAARPDLFEVDVGLREETERFSPLAYISIVDAVCPDRDCPIHADRRTPLVWDTIHLTPEGSGLVVGLIASRLDQVLARSFPQPPLARSGPTR